MRCGALWRKRPTSNGCGLLWRSRHGKSLRSTSGIAVTKVRNSCGPICRPSTGSRRRFIRINMPSTLGSFRRRNTKPLRSTPAKRIISSASITPCGSASPASSATLWPSLKTWRTTSVPSNISSAITISPGLQHYLYNTTLIFLRGGVAADEHHRLAQGAHALDQVCGAGRLPVPERDEHVAGLGHLVVTAHAGSLAETLPLGAEALRGDRVLPRPAEAEAVGAPGLAREDLGDTMTIRRQNLAQELIVSKCA